MAEPAEIAERELAGRLAAHARLLVNDIGADRRMHGDGHFTTQACDNDRGTAAADRKQTLAERLAESDIPVGGAIGIGERIIDKLAGLLRHPEASIPYRRRDIFGCLSEERCLGIMNRGGGVDRHAGNDPALDQIADHRDQPDLHYMRAEHQYHRLANAHRRCCKRRKAPEVTGTQDVRKRIDEQIEPGVRLVGARPFPLGDLALAVGDRDQFD